MSRITAALLILVQLAACGGGGGSATPPPPSGLGYPTPPPYTVGTAIAPLSPTVTGTVTSYAVSPTLPAGLSLSSSTGTISGTPTAASPETAYTITASNSGGSTKAVVDITVVAPTAGPSVSYPSLAYSLTVGAATDIAPVSTGGAVSSWSVSPALPAGLMLNADTGAITGTPTAVSLPASYLVTAENSDGKYQIGLTLQVVSNVLLDLGHARGIKRLLFSGTRLLSQDVPTDIDERAVSLCNLWNTATDTLVTKMQCSGAIALAGPTAVIEGPAPANGLQVLASSTGALQGRLMTPFSWWQLASDGSYIVLGSATGLSVFSPAGQSLYSAAGNYAAAKVFAAPGQVQIALGPAGTNVIETVNLASGVSATGPAFMGAFNEWFSDGGHFQTTVGTSVYTYTSASAKVDLTSFSTVQGLGGEGNYFWAFTSSGFTIFTVGASSTPALVVAAGGAPVFVSGSTIALSPSGTQLIVVDLSGASPVDQTYTLPAPVGGGIVAAVSPSDWFVGGATGLIFDGTSIATTPKYLDYGAALSIAGGAGVAAVATGLGIVVINVQTNTIEATIPFVSNTVQLSADGTVLAAGQTGAYGNALNVYSLPSGSLINGFPYAAGVQLVAYTLAPSGTLIAQVTAACNGCAQTQQISAVTGGTVLWSETQTLPDQGTLQGVLFSPDGTLFAVSNGEPDDINSPQQADIVTNIYQNYALTEAVAGWAVGWISNAEILTNTYEFSPQDSPIGLYTGATLYSPTGSVVATPTIKQLTSLVPVNPAGTEIYYPVLNAIYTLPAGSLAFGSSLYGESGLSENVPGAFASPYMVYLWGSHVVAVQPPQ